VIKNKLEPGEGFRRQTKAAAGSQDSTPALFNHAQAAGSYWI